MVQRSEALVAACIDHRGKQWKDVRAKRGSRLGTSGVVTALDSAAGRLAVKVRFDKDGESMWWRPEFLSLASVPLGGSVNPPPDVVPPRWGSEPAEQECLQLHYADETDVHGGCAVLNLTYASPRGGRGNLGGALFGVARWIGEQVELTEGFDRAELAWDGMLGLAPPHAKHRPFEQRWASRGLERPPEGRVSHSLVESMLLRKRAKANSPQEYEGVTFTLALGPWHTAASMQATRPMGRYQDGRPWTADEAAADVGAVPGLLKLGASHLGESAQGMGSTGLVDILPQSDGTRTYWKVSATRLRLEILAGSWESHADGWWRDDSSGELAESRVLKTVDVYSPSTAISMHADTGCPAVAYPSDKVDLISPYLNPVQYGGALPSNTTLAFSFLVQPANGEKPRLVRMPMPTAALRSELVGMMSEPGPGAKPYWVFGLPLWRHHQTTHVLQADGTPQLQLQLHPSTKKKKKAKKKSKAQKLKSSLDSKSEL